MGLLLNEYGLWRFCRRTPPSYDDESSNSTTDAEGRWELVASTTEQEVLDELGVEYVQPERRNFAFVMSKAKQGSILKAQRKDSKVRRSKSSSIEST